MSQVDADHCFFLGRASGFDIGGSVFGGLVVGVPEDEGRFGMRSTKMVILVRLERELTGLEGPLGADAIGRRCGSGLKTTM